MYIREKKDGPAFLLSFPTSKEHAHSTANFSTSIPTVVPSKSSAALIRQLSLLSHVFSLTLFMNCFPFPKAYLLIPNLSLLSLELLTQLFLFILKFFQRLVMLDYPEFLIL